MYESFEPCHLRDDYKVKKVHAHSPPLSKFITLSPIIIEVENGGLEDDWLVSENGGHFPLPWFWEQGVTWNLKITSMENIWKII